MDVDNKYRIVAALEGRFILFEKVGNHDETLKWGAAAKLDSYAERLSADPELPAKRQKGVAETEFDV